MQPCIWFPACCVQKHTQSPFTIVTLHRLHVSTAALPPPLAISLPVAGSTPMQQGRCSTQSRMPVRDSPTGAGEHGQRHCSSVFPAKAFFQIARCLCALGSCYRAPLGFTCKWCASCRFMRLMLCLPSLPTLPTYYACCACPCRYLRYIGGAPAKHVQQLKTGPHLEVGLGGSGWLVARTVVAHQALPGVEVQQPVQRHSFTAGTHLALCRATLLSLSILSTGAERRGARHVQVGPAAGAELQRGAAHQAGLHSYPCRAPRKRIPRVSCLPGACRDFAAFCINGASLAGLHPHTRCAA